MATSTSDGSLCAFVFGYNTLCDQEWMAVPMTVIAVECILFAFYLVLFGYSIWILVGQKRTAWIGATILLFLLSAAGTVISIIDIVTQITQVQNAEKIPLPSGWQAIMKLRNGLVAEVRRKLRGTTVAGAVLIVITNLVADVILLYRCYRVWGSRRRFAVVPGLFSLTATVFGIWSAIELSRIYGIFTFAPIIGSGGPKLSQFAIFIFAAVFSNLILTLIIAGRLIYITRRTNRYLESSGKGIYNVTTTVILESGLIYPIVLLVYTVILAIDVSNGSNVYWQPTKAFVTAHAVLYYSMIQITGIVPTLIIVRVGLGITVGDQSAGYDDVPARDLQTVPAPSAYLDAEKNRSSMDSVDFEVPESRSKSTVVYLPVFT